MQTKNLVLFFVLSTVTVIGWTVAQSYFFPPKRPPIEKLAAETWPWAGQSRNAQRVVVSQLSAAAVANGLSADPVIGVTAEIARLQTHPPQFEKKVEKPPEVVVEPPPVARAEDIPFGDDSFKLRVKLSPLGASVREVILSQFQAADEYGLPMWQDGNKHVPVPLHLVPAFRITEMKDNQIDYDRRLPFYHYRLYHYEKPDDRNPVDTLGKIAWKVVKKPDHPGADPQVAVFEADVPGQNVVITKTFTLGKGDYHVGLSVKVRARSGGTKENFRYQLTGSHGLPIEGVWYTYTYRNPLIGSVDRGGSGWRELEDIREIAFWGGGEQHARGDKMFRYAGIAVQYFASIVVVDNEQAPGVADNFIEKVRTTIEGEPNLQKPFLDDFTVRLMTEPLSLESGEIEHKYLLYNGPVKVRLLGHLTGDKAVDPQLVARYEDKLQLNTLTDYHSPGKMGKFSSQIGLTWLIIKFTNLIHELISYIHEVIPWYGLCIIGVTVLVRGCMFPISRKQAKNSMDMQEKMAKLNPEIKKLQEKYKDDMAGLNQARTELYLRHGINPLSTLGGCALLFAQMPVFLGLYYALQESIHFRLDSFLWMPNLAAPDMLSHFFGPVEVIPWISRPADMGSFIYLGPFFNLLPIVAVSLMIVQQKMMTPPPQDEQQEMQQKMMKYMMVVFGLMFYKVAAGLCIYFIASSLWGLTERKMLPKKKPASGEAPAAAPPPSTSKTGRLPKVGTETNGGVFQRLKDRWGEVLKSAAKQGQARREDAGPKRKKKKDSGA